MPNRPSRDVGLLGQSEPAVAEACGVGKQQDGSRGGQPHEGFDEYRRHIAVRIASGRPALPDALEHLLEMRAAFAAWLRARTSDAIVGDYPTPDDSPLANFIWDTLVVYVDMFGDIFDGERFYVMPTWCAEFTRWEADYIARRWREGGDELTAGEVLGILQRVVGREGAPDRACQTAPVRCDTI